MARGKAKTVATKAPTGIAIKRNNETFTISWKRGDANYNVKQQLNYRIMVNGKWQAWKAIVITTATTAKSMALRKADYFPNNNKQLQALEVRIRGQRAKAGNVTYTVSGWATKSYTIYAPLAPTLEANPDRDLTNRCVFTWYYGDNPEAIRAFTRVEYQTMLVADVAVDDPSKLNWTSTATGWQEGSVAVSGTYSRTVTEETADIAVGSHTRVFRVRAVGVAGASAWRNAKYVYADPNPAVITDSPQANVLGDGSTRIYVPWEVTDNAANPVDSMTVEYAIGTPRADLQPPLEPSWVGVGDAITKGASNAISFSVTQPLDDDQCIWCRVNTVHFNRVTEGAATLARVGGLAMPTITTVDTNESTHRATITAVNHSDVPDSFLVILFRRETAPNADAVVGVMPHGTTSITVTCPAWGADEAIAFGVYAAVGTYTELTGQDGTTSYAVDARMRSAGEAWRGGEVPQAPETVQAYPTTTTGTVRVQWSWSWQGADSAVISWADHADAWESTDEPDEYTVSNLHASEWNVAGLETGKTWYIRVRLAMTKEDGVTYSPWSAMQTVDLSSAPTTPTLVLSDTVVPVGSVITAYWSYATTDGTTQAYAQVCECTVAVGGIIYGDTIMEVETAQHVEIDTAAVGWSAGETHYLAVRVVSGSGKVSDDWSAPVPVMIAEPLEAEITSTSLVQASETVDGVERTYTALTQLPLTVTVEGAGAGGTTMLAIERAAEYHMDRPDGSVFNGYDGETVYLHTQTGETTITVSQEDLNGYLDDGAQYRLVATVRDGLGQSSTVTQEFEVDWSHQAVIPTATIVIEDNVAKITPVEPAGYASGDVVDVYRLSADDPELVLQGCEFGVTYVDPYPAIGEYGGYRIVYRTKDGDYITADSQPAWTDYGEDEDVYLDTDGRSIIDFDGDQILLYYNVDVSNTWEKDFRQTRYLGGSIQGDWNAGVARSASVSVTTINMVDYDTVRALKRLAAYTNQCHLRTTDGSSYTCDIQVAESRTSDKYNEVAEFQLTVNRIDTQELDGMTLAEWEEGN